MPKENNVRTFNVDDFAGQLLSSVPDSSEPALAMRLYELLCHLTLSKADGADSFETAYYMHVASQILSQHVPAQSLLQLVERCFTVHEENYFSEKFTFYDYVRAVAHLCKESSDGVGQLLALNIHDFGVAVYDQAEIDRADYDHN